MNKPNSTKVQTAMKTIVTILLVAMTALFSSCSTSTLYYKPLTQRPAGAWQGHSSKWGGYIENKHASDTYTVSYEAYNRPSAEVAGDFALLRSAERTVLDGKRYFYAKPTPSLNTKSQESYFPAYVVPGYWETERVRHCIRNRRGERECYYDYEDIWCPPEYVPAKNVVNYIHTARIDLTYKGRKSQRHDAHQIIHDALLNLKGLGKPKLDPRVINVLKQASQKPN